MIWKGGLLRWVWHLIDEGLGGKVGLVESSEESEQILFTESFPSIYPRHRTNRARNWKTELSRCRRHGPLDFSALSIYRSLNDSFQEKPKNPLAMLYWPCKRQKP